MNEFLFNPSWWAPAVVLVGGLVVFFQGNKLQKTGLRNAGLGVVGLAIVYALLAHFIDTAREKVEKNSYAIVSAAGSSDWTTFQKLLDPKVRIFSYDGPVAVTNAAQAGASSIGLKSASISGMEVQQSQDLYIVNVRVFSVQDRMPTGTLPTDWTFEWRENPEGWQLYRIRFNESAQINSGQVQSHLPSVNKK